MSHSIAGHQDVVATPCTRRTTPFHVPILHQSQNLEKIYITNMLQNRSALYLTMKQTKISRDMKVNGNNALYYYFRDVDERNRSVDETLLKHLVRSLAIWLPIELYQRLPVLLPFVVRDPTCRKSNNKEKIEEWGSSDKKGYFRDDNTLVKAIPRKFTISGKNIAYDKQTIGAKFVASHIWSKLDSSSDLATRDPLTNTFVPNPGLVA